jgi:hypothetical protein
MTKKVRARSAGLLALVLATGGFAATSTVATAQYQSGYRRDTLSTASYDRMRQWARELDQVASYANRQAQADQAGYRGSRRDGNFLKSIRNFAARTSQFRSRMESYRTSAWNVDDELDRLIRDARNVQNRIDRARFVDPSTRRDWSRVVDLLNRMQNESRYPGYQQDDRWTRSGAGGYDRSRDYYSTSDFRQLARELDERAARMAQLASVSGTRYGTRYGYSSEVRRFGEQARAFRDEVDNRNFSRSELRSRVNRLLEDARNAHSEIAAGGADPRVADEWDGIVRVLDRMRDLVV